MSETVPSVTLNNGKVIPAIGLGTWQSSAKEVTQAVMEAIDIGYRHIDGAYVYGNEKNIGEAINAKIDEGVIKREDIFLTSKLWNTFHHPDLVLKSVEKSLKNFNTPYLDLYLIHFPVAFSEGTEIFPKDDSGNVILSDVDYLQTWTEMEKAVELGFVKSIGVSNFNKRQMERLLTHCRIKPVTNQVECHPYLTNTSLSDLCHANDVPITAYSPLGAPASPFMKKSDPILLNDPTVAMIAKSHQKSAAQILLRYQIQRGHIVIPKSVTKSRIQSNFEIFNFDLTDEDMDNLNGLNINKRYVSFEHAKFHRYYPFNEHF